MKPENRRHRTESGGYSWLAATIICRLHKHRIEVIYSMRTSCFSLFLIDVFSDLYGKG